MGRKRERDRERALRWGNEDASRFVACESLFISTSFCQRKRTPSYWALTRAFVSLFTLFSLLACCCSWYFFGRCCCPDERARTLHFSTAFVLNSSGLVRFYALLYMYYLHQSVVCIDFPFWINVIWSGSIHCVIFASVPFAPPFSVSQTNTI